MTCVQLPVDLPPAANRAARRRHRWRNEPPGAHHLVLVRPAHRTESIRPCRSPASSTGQKRTTDRAPPQPRPVPHHHRHGFGQGKYHYYAYHFARPDRVTARHRLCAPAAAANQWNPALGIAVRYPDTHPAFIERCRQTNPLRLTALILRYRSGDYNGLDHDAHGAHMFPLKIATLLSEPATQFSGGEFILTEQRPRRPLRAQIAPLRRSGAVQHRPVAGAGGVYRVNLRHRASPVRLRQRYTLALIFHDIL